jgi:peroxiredoxin
MNSSRAALLSVLVVGALISVSGCKKNPRQSPPERANSTSGITEVFNVTKRADKVPDFSWKDSTGGTVSFDKLRGKVTLINFWATWCGPCKIETPWFIDLQTRYGARGLQVLGISIDDPLSLLKPYAAEHKISYPVLQALGHREVVSAFGPLRGVPTTYIISRDGKLCAKHIGVTAREGFESQVAGLLSSR